MKTMSAIPWQNVGNFETTQLFDCSIKRSLWYALVIILVVLLASCQDKTKGQDVSVKPGKGLKTETKPKVSVKVNRHFDDKGNMIGFDSTYSSYYSNVEGDTSGMDTLFKSFDHYFNHGGRASLMDEQFNSLFFQDSLLNGDFFHDDFFLKRYELNDAYMKKMMTQMDSLKNKFYKEHARVEEKRRKQK